MLQAGNIGRYARRMIPIGKLIKNKLDEKGLSAVWLAERVPCSRANIYKIFNKNSVDTEMLYRISVILQFNFFQYYVQALDE